MAPQNTPPVDIAALATQVAERLTPMMKGIVEQTMKDSILPAIAELIQRLVPISQTTATSKSLESSPSDLSIDGVVLEPQVSTAVKRTASDATTEGTQTSSNAKRLKLVDSTEHTSTSGLWSMQRVARKTKNTRGPLQMVLTANQHRGKPVVVVESDDDDDMLAAPIKSNKRTAAETEAIFLDIAPQVVLSADRRLSTAASLERPLPQHTQSQYSTSVRFTTKEKGKAKERSLSAPTLVMHSPLSTLSSTRTSSDLQFMNTELTSPH